MRPPANIVRQWMKEKNSFPVRGLVMLHVPGQGWLCNIEILRVSRIELETMAPDDAAFEIALSAIFRYITSTVYTGESVPVTTTRGAQLLVPAIAFEMAPFLAYKVKKVLADGGGGINVNQVAVSSKLLAKSLTGSAKDAQAYGLPKVVTGAQRVKHRLEYEARLTVQQMKAMARRRKMLARHWLKRKGGSFHQRGLVFSSDAHGFWSFNVPSGNEKVEHASEDLQALQDLAFEVGLEAASLYCNSTNYTKDGETRIGIDRYADTNINRLPPDILTDAARRVATRLLALMKKNQHGVLSHKVIERCLSLAWDPLDDKPLENYPFPEPPSTDYLALDRAALDAISAAHSKNRVRKSGDDVQPQLQPKSPDEQTVTDADAQPPSQSWRQELEIDDWVPLDEPVEDDETIDRKALEKADHDQSAALRRLRGNAGGRITADDTASPVHHKVDYAGLPKDD